MTQIVKEAEHILVDAFEELDTADWNLLLIDDDNNPITGLGKVYNELDQQSKQRFRELGGTEYKNRIQEKLESLDTNEFQAMTEDQNKEMNIYYNSLPEDFQETFAKAAAKELKVRNPDMYDEIFDKNINENINENQRIIEKYSKRYDEHETVILQSIKESTIFNGESLFSRSAVYDELQETTNIDRDTIENYMSNINESFVPRVPKALNPEYNRIHEALKAVLPVNYPQINETQSSKEIWDTIKQNPDWLLESKLKTHLRAKNTEQNIDLQLKSGYSTKSSTPSTPKSLKQKIHESTKLQKSILNENLTEQDYSDIEETLKVLEKLKKHDIEIAQGVNHLVEMGVKLDKYEKEFTGLRESIQEKLETQIKESGSNKELKYRAFFDYDEVITESGYMILLKETENSFMFNIVSEAFTQKPKLNHDDLLEQINEDYVRDLQKARKTLQRKYKNKNFIATSLGNEDGMITKDVLDTKAFRIHLYNSLKDSTDIKFNIEYLYNPDQTIDDINESMTKRKFEKYLENGDYITVNDQILWYSSSRKWMLDMEISTFDKIWDLYNIADKKLNKPKTKTISENLNETESNSEVMSKEEFEQYITDGNFLTNRETGSVLSKNLRRDYILDGSEVSFDTLYRTYLADQRNFRTSTEPIITPDAIDINQIIEL